MFSKTFWKIISFTINLPTLLSQDSNSKSRIFDTTKEHDFVFFQTVHEFSTNKRSRQKHKPTENMKKGASGLANIDTMDFRDANNEFFFEPTTELGLVNNLYQGWFSVVFVPTFENDIYRWHIFAYNSETRKVELTAIRASGEGLFDVRDYTILEESNDRLVPLPRLIDQLNKGLHRRLTLISAIMLICFELKPYHAN